MLSAQKTIEEDTYCATLVLKETLFLKDPKRQVADGLEAGREVAGGTEGLMQAAGLEGGRCALEGTRRRDIHSWLEELLDLW